MPVPFFAIFTRTPRDESWFFASHLSHAAGVSKNSTGSSFMWRTSNRCGLRTAVRGNVQLVAIKATFGRGLLAGAIGTAAMTASSTIEQRLRKWPASRLQQRGPLELRHRL